MLARVEKVTSNTVAGVNGGSAAVAIEGQSDLVKELAEVQSQFDAYRTEMGVDSVRLRRSRRVAAGRSTSWSSSRQGQCKD